MALYVSIAVAVCVGSIAAVLATILECQYLQKHHPALSAKIRRYCWRMLDAAALIYVFIVLSIFGPHVIFGLGKP